MHVNQVRLAEKTDSISWEEQPSEWTAADTGSNEIENMIHQIQHIILELELRVKEKKNLKQHGLRK